MFSQRPIHVDTLDFIRRYSFVVLKTICIFIFTVLAEENLSNGGSPTFFGEFDVHNEDQICVDGDARVEIRLDDVNGKGSDFKDSACIEETFPHLEDSDNGDCVNVDEDTAPLGSDTDDIEAKNFEDSEDNTSLSETTPTVECDINFFNNLQCTLLTANDAPKDINQDDKEFEIESTESTICHNPPTNEYDILHELGYNNIYLNVDKQKHPDSTTWSSDSELDDLLRTNACETAEADSLDGCSEKIVQVVHFWEMYDNTCVMSRMHPFIEKDFIIGYMHIDIRQRN